MNENNVKKFTGNENDILFGIPDTGVSVSWDFSAGCATDEKKGTHLKPVTPKQSKLSSTSATVYRRRCLTNQMKLPTNGDAAFAEEMLSLVSVNRKNIIKSSGGVSPLGRSPRTLRSKMSKPSPLRDDKFLFLLNDSMENDDMIRCSQITEAALKEESPLVPKKEGRMSSVKRLSGRDIGSPQSRKRLIDAITSCQKVSPLRQSNNLPSEASITKAVTESTTKAFASSATNAVATSTTKAVTEPTTKAFASSATNAVASSTTKAVTEPTTKAFASSATNAVASSTTKALAESNRKIVGDVETAKNTDQCNNNVESAFGMVDDDLFLNFLDDFSKSEISVVPKKSPRLSLNQRRQQSIPGVTPIIRANTNNLTVPPKIPDTGTCIKNDPIVDIVAACENLDDGMDLDLELSPHILDLLDGHVDGPGGKASKEVPSKTVETKTQPCRPVPTGRPIKAQADAEPLKSSVPKQVPTMAKQNSASLSSVPEKLPGVVLSQSAKPTVEKPSMVSKGLTRHASAPGLSRGSLSVQAPKPVQNQATVRKCTPEEIERKRQEALKKLKKSQNK